MKFAKKKIGIGSAMVLFNGSFFSNRSSKIDFIFMVLILGDSNI